MPMTLETIMNRLYHDFLMIYPCPEDETWNICTNPAFRSGNSISGQRYQEEFIILCSAGNPERALKRYEEGRDSYLSSQGRSGNEYLDEKDLKAIKSLIRNHY